MSSTTPIPKRLKEARKAKGLSQKKLGILAGIDESGASARMNQYEKGYNTPPYSLVQKIAQVLEVPTCYFYAEDEDIAELIIKQGVSSSTEAKKPEVDHQIEERVQNRRSELNEAIALLKKADLYAEALTSALEEKFPNLSAEDIPEIVKAIRNSEKGYGSSHSSETSSQ